MRNGRLGGGVGVEIQEIQEDSVDAEELACASDGFEGVENLVAPD